MPYQSNPHSKGELIDRLLSRTFEGDLREVAKDPSTVKIRRPKPHVVSLGIGGKEYLLMVKIPRDEATRKSIGKKLRERIQGKKPKPAPKAKAPPKERKGGTGRY